MPSKRTKALAIPPSVKQKVWERQKGKSLFAPYQNISVEECCCHYISRGCGGLGIEENIFGCAQKPWINEHRLFDEHKPIGNLTPEQCESVIKNHFKQHYPNWNEKYLKYKKGLNNV